MSHCPDNPDASPRAFYDHLASDYDEMVDFGARVDAARAFVRRLPGRQAATRALDLGCGTGAYTMALASCGIEATGLDLSPNMLVRARRHAAATPLSASAVFRTGTMLDLGAYREPPRDLVLCMGNALPHLIDPADLARAFAEISAVLTPGGRAVVQLLNYADILQRAERIVSIDRSGATELIRFYDFLPDGCVRFNLLRITWTGNTASHNPINSVMLRPYTLPDIAAAAGAADLAVHATAGGLDLTPFDPAASETLLVLMRKP